MPATDRVHSPTPEELMAYLDGETPADSRVVIETHIGACADCRRTIAELRGVTHAMTAWEPEAAPATLRPPRAPRANSWTLRAFSWRPGYMAIAFGGAAATVLLVGSSLLISPRHGFQTDTPVLGQPQFGVVDGPLNGRLDSNGSAAHGLGVGGRARLGGAGGGRPTAIKEAVEESKSIAVSQAAPQGQTATASRQPSVIRTATLRLVASDFNAARASVEGIVAQAGGFLDQITVNSAPGSARALTGALRVPAPRLAEALTKLRQLGQVTEDTQGSEDVTDQLVDLDTRLANSRTEEQRLNDILKNRTGKLSDVLEVERQISRVRLEIEQMDAQRANMDRRVTYATITLQIDEVRKAGLESGPLSLSTRLSVAAADGLESALESIVGALLFLLRAGPAAALWIGAAALSWLAIRRFRRSQTQV
jgi:hypothetical protein